MDDHLNQFRQLLDDTRLDSDTRIAIFEAIDDIEQEHTGQLEQAWRRKYEMLHQAASEFREDLRLITGNLHFVLYSDITLSNSMLDKLLNHAKEHLLYTNAVRDLSEIKLQRLNLTPENIDVYQFLGELEKLCLRTDIHLVTHRDNTIGSLTSDSKWLRQALVNLLLLGNHPQPEDKPVELVATRHGSMIRFAFNIQPINTNPKSIVQMFTDFEHLYPVEFGIEGFRLSVAYHLCQMMNSGLAMAETSDGNVEIVLEFDTDDKDPPRYLTSNR